MTYEITCPDPECKTTFEMEESDFDEAYDNEEPIQCPVCEVEFEWDFDPDATPQITLTIPAEYEDPEDGTDDEEMGEDDE
jgi:hypothetical protein